MKTYEEMTEAVLRRRDDYVKQQKKQRKALAVVCALCLLAASSVAAGHALPGILPGNDTSGTDLSDVVSLSMESRLFLAADGQQTLLTEGVELPSAYSLSVQDIRGLSEAEVDAVIEQERTYQDAVLEEAEVISNASVLRRDNAVVSTVRLGEFELEIDDPEKVAFITGKTATKYGRVEFFAQSPDISKEDFGPYSSQTMTLSGEYYQLLMKAEENGTGRLVINWKPSAELFNALDENPDLPLSTFSDAFILQVEYTDGTCEEHIIDILFNDSGEAEINYRSDIPDTIVEEDVG